MIDSGKLVLDAPIDEVKEQYRRIEAVFPEPVEERDFQLPGVERVQREGCMVSLFASRNLEAIMEHIGTMRAGNIDVCRFR